MENLKLTMKLTRANTFSVEGNEGITFRLQEFDYRHEATLMLKRSGEPNPDAHKSPLYALQGVEVGAMCEVEFAPYQDRRQESREGSRDSVKDVIGLRLVAVRPSPANPSGANGQAQRDKAPAA